MLAQTFPSFTFPATNSFYKDGGSPENTGAWGRAVQAGNSGSVNDYGVWFDIGVLQGPCYGLRISLNNLWTAATEKHYLMNIGFGTSPTAVTKIASDLIAGPAAHFLGANDVAMSAGRVYYLPIYIPESVSPLNIYGQGQASGFGPSITAKFIHLSGNPGITPFCQYVESMGHVPGTGAGVSVTHTTTAGTEGAWIQIVPSTPNNYIGLIMAVGQQSAAMTNGWTTWDIAIGPPGSEIEIGTNIFMMIVTQNEAVNTISHPVFYNVPAGTAISVRGAGNMAVSTPASAIIYGLVG
jgi:hypothetical protein